MALKVQAAVYTRATRVVKYTEIDQLNINYRTANLKAK